jgi:DNA-binding transcriptional MerR regulator
MGMRRRYSIGEFSALSGTSAKTLRFYDEIGLLRPGHVDPRTAYRFYTANQLEDLVAIAELKELGLSLAQIAAVRNGKARVSDVLCSLREQHEQSIQRSTEAIRWIDSQLHAGPSNQCRVTLKRRHAMRVVSLRAKVRRYEEIAGMQEFLNAKFEQEWGHNVRGVLWHRCADEGTLEGEAFVEIGARTARVRGVDYVELGAAVVASAYSADDDVAAEQRYDSIRGWMQARGYRLAGPKREIDLGGMLDIQFPVAD